MKPNMIFSVLDMARKIRLETGKAFNPLFVGEAGLGKSEICQSWVKSKQLEDPTFGFFDLRLAYMEGPDFIGLPKLIESKADAMRLVTDHIIPKMWDDICSTPNGLLLVEEPNRANSSVLNCLMQVLTDHKIHNVSLPKGWIIAGAINPDSAGYDVNTMDTALRDRFVPFEIVYDQETFVSFMKGNNWHSRIISFVESGIWMYKKSNEIGDNPDAKYVSPRTFSPLNQAEKMGLDLNDKLHFETSVALLGKTVGREYYNFTFNQRPVMVEDIVSDKKEAYARLEAYSNPKNYRNDLINVTVINLIDKYMENPQVTNKMVVEVAEVIAADQAGSLLIAICNKSAQNGKIVKMEELLALSPDLTKRLKVTLKRDQTK
jgi:hypothetical protein